MKNIITTPAQRVSLIIKELGISKNEFARMIGISSTLISKITTKNTNFGVETAEKIVSSIPRLNSVWFLTGEGEIWNDHVDKSESKISNKSGFSTDFHIKPLPPEQLLEEFERNGQKFMSFLEVKYPELKKALSIIEDCSGQMMMINDIISRNGLDIEIELSRKVGRDPQKMQVFTKNPEQALKEFLPAFEIAKIITPLINAQIKFMNDTAELEVQGLLKNSVKG